MFTGLVEEIGKIKKITKRGKNLKLSVNFSEDFLKDVVLGDSIAVNGVCLTVEELTKEQAVFSVMSATYDDTNIKRLKIGDLVNAEKALKANSRLGGHIVTGHIDCETKIKRIIKNSSKTIFSFQIPEKLRNFIVLKGSVAIDGVSLTVQEVKNNYFSVSLIPETLKRTIFKYRKQGDYVNIEVDSVLKTKENAKKSITESYLRSLGY